MTDTLMIFPDTNADSVKARKPSKKNKPAPMGTGPKNKKCKDCQHFIRQEYSRTYFKCGLINWTHGSATDIRANDPSCEKFNDPV